MKHVTHRITRRAKPTRIRRVCRSSVLESLEERRLLSVALPTPPALSSLPGAANTLYLDFNQHGEAMWSGYSNIAVEVYDIDGNVDTFNAEEEAAIISIWRQVAEDFSPFDINVTTVEPSSGTFRRVAIGNMPDNNLWFYSPVEQPDGTFKLQPNGSGVATSAESVAWVFPEVAGGNRLARAIAATVSHEAGHMLTLDHRSDVNPITGLLLTDGEYSLGSDGLRPIMGDSVNRLWLADRIGWTTGSYSRRTGDLVETFGYGSRPPQDAVATLAAELDLRTDDHDSLGTSSLIRVGNHVEGSGVIETTLDEDWFSFTTAGGFIDLTIVPGSREVAYASNPGNYTTGSALTVADGNLDVKWELHDSTRLIATHDPSSSLGARIQGSLTPGTYSLVVKSANILDGDLGLYSIFGTIPAPPTEVAPQSRVIRIEADQGVFTGTGSVNFTSPIAPGSGPGSTVLFSVDTNSNGRWDAGELVFSTSPVSGDIATASFDTSTLPVGRHSFVARFFDGTSVVNSVATSIEIVSAPNEVPTVASVSASPTIFTRGQNTTLTVNGISDDGSVELVQFVWDFDGSGDISSGDAILGTSTSVLSGQASLVIDTHPINTGLQQFIARARDNNGVWSDWVATTVTVNAPGPTPFIGSISPNASFQGHQFLLTITANEVSNASEVSFYHDTNGNGNLDSGDELLRTDDDGSNGWWWRNSPQNAGFPIGLNRFFAQATGSGGQLSNIVHTTVITYPLDTTPPSVSDVVAPDIHNVTSDYYEFQVTYADNIAIDGDNSFNFSDFDIEVVNSSGSWSVDAEFLYVDPPDDASEVTATYRMPARDGMWNTGHNDEYRISSRLTTAVRDTNGNVVPPGQIGTFRVQVPNVDLSAPVVTLQGISATVDFPSSFGTGPVNLSSIAIDGESGINPSSFQYAINQFDGVAWMGWSEMPQAGATTSLTGLSDGLYAVAVSAANGNAAVASSSVGYLRIDTRPEIGAFSSDSPTVVQGLELLGLTVTGLVDPDGQVTSVDYYWDANDNGQLDIGTDVMVATDYVLSGETTSHVDVSTEGVPIPVGGQRFFAVANDNDGQQSSTAMTMVGVFGQLSVSVSTSSVVENSGASAAMVTVSRTGDLSALLEVVISYGGAFPDGATNLTSLTGPLSVTIPPALSSVSFSVDTIDDALPEIDVQAPVYAFAEGYTDDSDSLLVIDDDTAVSERYIFYKDSNLGNEPAPDKSALMPGETADFSNYTSYSLGINGLMIDIQGLQGTPSSTDFDFKVGNDDFPDTWSPVATDPTISLSPLDAITDRITLEFPNNLISNQWLQVTVKASPNTGLKSDEVFYFGNAIGETGNGTVTNAFGTFVPVNSTDEIDTRNNQGIFRPIDDVYDFNRDKLVNATDQILARNNQTIALGDRPNTALRLITVPAIEGDSAESGEPNGDMPAATISSLVLQAAPLVKESGIQHDTEIDHQEKPSGMRLSEKAVELRRAVVAPELPARRSLSSELAIDADESVLPLRSLFVQASPLIEEAGHQEDTPEQHHRPRLETSHSVQLRHPVAVQWLFDPTSFSPEHSGRRSIGDREARLQMQLFTWLGEEHARGSTAIVFTAETSMVDDNELLALVSNEQSESHHHRTDDFFEDEGWDALLELRISWDKVRI